MALRATLAALVLALCFCGAAQAGGRGGLSPLDVYAPGWQSGAPAIAARAAAAGGAAVWRSGSGLVAEAARYVGSGKFTPFAGPWCADAVSAWLVHVGKPPLANRMAGAALSYGPRSVGRRGDLVVLGHYRASHVGIVESIDSSGTVHIISGNWGRRVARGVISRREVMAFIAVH